VAASPLKLLGLDKEDLQIVSAAAQDAIFKVADAVWLPSARRFSIRLQRFVWERDNGAGAKGQRIWAVLSFEGVLGVKAHKVAQSRRDAFASLLSISFEEAGEAPAGMITLSLADGGAIALDVECIDAVLADIGEAREAVGRPDHG
jgi:hypothetical protein